MPDCPILISNDLVCDEDTESNNTEDPPNNDCNAPQEVSGYQYVQTTVLPVDTMDQNMTTECYDAGYVTDFIQHTGSLDSTVHPASYSDGDGEVGIDCQGIGPTELQVGLKFNTWFTENSPIGYQYVQTTVLPVDTMDQNMTTECYDAGYVTDFIQHTGSLDSTVHPASYSDGDGEVGIDCQGIGPTELQVGLKFNTWFTENSPIIGSLRPFTCLSGLCHLSDSLLVESIQGVVPQHNESVCTGYCDEPTCMSPTDANPLPNGLYPFICLTE